METLKKSQKRRVAAEMFSAAFCPLNCQYCYIPKTPLMKDLQEELNESLKKGEIVSELKKFYGKELKHLGLWGAEPTLNLPLIKNMLPALLEEFPELERIAFSTSLMTDPNLVLDFIKGIGFVKKPFLVNCQISLDGPDFVTDKNRIRGAAKKIPENLFYLFQKLNETDLGNIKLELKFKSTLTMENMEHLNSKKSRIKEYFDYFEWIFREYLKRNKNANVSLAPSTAPSLAVPGKYTKKDGETLALFFYNLRMLAKQKKRWKHLAYTKDSRKYKEYTKPYSLNIYSRRFARLIQNQEELFIKPSMFTCSGGDSNFGIETTGEMHICHRMFFLNNQKYIDSIMKKGDIENWDVSLFFKGNIDLINKKYTFSAKNKKTWPRPLYILRSYHDFTRLRNSYIVSMIKELALAGQADKRFLKDDDLCFMLAVFLNSALSCPAEQLLNTGVIHFIPVSVVRLWGSGAFFEVLKDYEENFSTGK